MTRLLPAAAAALALMSSMAPAVGRAEEAPITSGAHILTERQQPAVINAVLEDRLKTLLPDLMREAGIDMWLVLNREYNEDPVYFSLVPAPTYAARRTTMLVFHDRGEEEGVDLLTVNRYPLGAPYESAWEGGDLEEQWRGLGDLIAEKNPQKIGVNMSRHWPVADGLSEALHTRLMDVLSPELQKRVVSAEELAVRWLETRSELELELYPQIVGLARGVIAEAFSNDV
ncbi:MAG: Xaa-Pro aminopeptidase, partial [Acidobacteriota bacterium]